jgi:hypothetical protein
MAEGNQPITLIVATPISTAEESTDRGGGETHSLRSFFTGTVAKAVEIDPDKIRTDIDKCLAQMKQIFADLQKPSIVGWKVEHISIGLSISAEGSVGVATAGVEASIEIEFAPEK